MLPLSIRDFRDVFLHAPTDRLSDLLWRDWHRCFRRQPSTDTPFPDFDRRVMETIQSRVWAACAYIIEREIDPEDSLRIFIETLLRFTGSRPYTRFLVVRVGLRDVVRLEHAKMIVEFAKSVPPEEIYSDDSPLHQFVGRGEEGMLWVAAGAPTIRAHPSDPSLLIDSLPSSAPILLQEGESPDDVGGRCLVLKQVAFESTTASEADFRWRSLPFVVGAVWFSNLPCEQLQREVHQGYADHNGVWDSDRSQDSTQEATFMKLVQELVDIRDTLRPLVDLRRREALTCRFAKSPLRLLPLHVAIHCLEFIVFPAASKRWIGLVT